MLIKRILLGFVTLIVGLVLLRALIIPFTMDALGIPTLDTWYGLAGFLRLLPWLWIVGIVLAFTLSIIRSARGDDDEG